MKSARTSIKLIGIDVDGTLLDSQGQIPADNLAAIEEAASRGIHIAIATGRSYFFALPAVAPLPDPLTLIVHNGAIARTRTGETLLRRLLPRDVARAVLEATSPWRDSTVVIFDRPLSRQMVYDQMDWTHPNRARFHARNREIIEQVAVLEDAITEDPVQVSFNGSVAAMRAVVATLEGAMSEGEVTISLTEYPARDFSLVDVCARGTSKGTGLAAIAAELGIARAEVMAVGDNHNDRDMLDWAGVGIVMGNALPELKAAGFHVTASNDEAGLAQAIRSIAL